MHNALRQRAKPMDSNLKYACPGRHHQLLETLPGGTKKYAAAVSRMASIWLLAMAGVSMAATVVMAQEHKAPGATLGDVSMSRNNVGGGWRSCCWASP
jgi:hypothetical protein